MSIHISEFSDEDKSVTHNEFEFYTCVPWYNADTASQLYIWAQIGQLLCRFYTCGSYGHLQKTGTQTIGINYALPAQKICDVYVIRRNKSLNEFVNAARVNMWFCLTTTQISLLSIHCLFIHSLNRSITDGQLRTIANDPWCKRDHYHKPLGHLDLMGLPVSFVKLSIGIKRCIWISICPILS